jgi:thiol-disulfide isomerase/thioredoxin
MTTFVEPPHIAKQVVVRHERKWLTRFVALLLVVAAGLKLWSFATTPSFFAHWTDNPFVVLDGSAFEILLASWLASGWHRRIANAVAIFFFSIVACIAASKWWSGELSCGCFGPLKVSPWTTTFLDIAILTSLLWQQFRKSLERARPSKAWVIEVLLLGGTLAGALPAVAYHFHPVATSTEGMTDSGGLIVLEPEKWVGKPCPLTRYITVQSPISLGTCRIVLFHSDCPDCQRLLPQVEEIARNKGIRTILVEIPPVAPPEQSIVPYNTVCEIGLLDASKEWFATTPVIIDLSNGQVVRQQSGAKAQP